jgi:regulator of RNase E activity RraA
MGEISLIYEEAEMTDVEIIERLGKLSAANVSDVQHRRNSMASRIKPIVPGVELVGRAYTVRTGPGHHMAIIQGLVKAKPGQVLVVDEGGYTEGCVVGELVTHYARKRELAGIVIDGAVRDTAYIRKVQFPVFAAAIIPRGGEGGALGDWDVPVQCGGVRVRPGDWIVGDDDGVSVIPDEIVEEVLERAEQLKEKEARVLVHDEDLLVVYGMEELLSKLEAEAKATRVRVV